MSTMREVPVEVLDEMERMEARVAFLSTFFRSFPKDRRMTLL